MNKSNSSSLSTLSSRIHSIFERPIPRSRVSPQFSINCGLETHIPPSSYYYNGLKRGGNPREPYLVFQYTLDGYGIFQTPQKKWILEPENAFFAIIPSSHAYYFPSSSKQWTFFWIIFQHTYLAQRIQNRQAQSGPVLRISPESPLLGKSIDLIELIASSNPHDELTLEQILFEWLIQYERLVNQTLYPQQEREKLLKEVRSYILANLSQKFGVSEVASFYGMSRSHFSHFFKKKTGYLPYDYILHIRLEEASHLLLTQKDKLEVIAQKTGFTDANHLCKIFRKHFHMTPGTFRKQT